MRMEPLFYLANVTLWRSHFNLNTTVRVPQTVGRTEEDGLVRLWVGSMVTGTASAPFPMRPRRRPNAPVVGVSEGNAAAASGPISHREDFARPWRFSGLPFSRFCRSCC